MMNGSTKELHDRDKNKKEKNQQRHKEVNV